MHRLRPLALLVTLAGTAALAAAPGCATLQEIAALRQVDFELSRVSQSNLAGVDLDRYAQGGGGALNPMDLARVSTALARGELPMRFNLHVAATNPPENGVAAQLVRLDWTLFLEGTETVSGIFNDTRQLRPGTTTDIPIAIELDLVRFFGRNVGDLVNLALNLSGQGGAPTNVRLQARPTVNTQFGPISYPGTISIETRVGRR